MGDLYRTSSDPYSRIWSNRAGPDLESLMFSIWTAGRSLYLYHLLFSFLSMALITPPESGNWNTLVLPNLSYFNIKVLFSCSLPCLSYFCKWMIHMQKSNCKWSLLEALCFCDVGHEGESENYTDSNLMIFLLMFNLKGTFQHPYHLQLLSLSVMV